MCIGVNKVETKTNRSNLPCHQNSVSQDSAVDILIDHSKITLLSSLPVKRKGIGRWWVGYVKLRKILFIFKKWFSNRKNPDECEY